MKWDGPALTLAVECLGQSSTTIEAAAKLSARVGESVSTKAIAHAFDAAKMAPPSAYLGRPKRFGGAPPPDFDDDVTVPQRDTWPVEQEPLRQHPGFWEAAAGGEGPGDVARRSAAVASAFRAEHRGDRTDEFRRLVDVARKGPFGFSDLCDALDMSPRKARELIEDAQRAGYHIEVTPGGHVGWRAPDANDSIIETGMLPVLGERQIVGVISDTHLGSKYCLREQLKDFVHAAYERGAREILHPGDVLDGDYKHGRFELTHHGLEDQTQDLFETMPRLPGLKYYFIEGNHDNVFTDRNGASTGRYIVDYFRNAGRDDWHCVGNRGAFLRIRGAVFNLWHPRSGGAYALSYPLQKYVEKISSAFKPQCVLAGHWHVHASLFSRGIHAIACPTFQGGGSPFGRSLGGQPAMGGLILSWGATEHGTMREFDLSYRAYFEREQLVTFGDEPVRSVA